MFVKLIPKLVSLDSLNASVYIDSSGSTGGAIMRSQLRLQQELGKFLKINKFVDWNNIANLHDKIPKTLWSGSDTNPTCFLKYWNNEELAIVFTDGQIDQNTMVKFKKELGLKMLTSIPVIIVLTISSIETKTIDQIAKTDYVNMSIPESFLSLSNDVLILLNDGLGIVRTLISKGEFSNYFPAPTLDDSTCIAFSSVPEFANLKKIIVGKNVPSNLVKLPAYQDYIDLNELNKISEVESIDIIEQLCSRGLLPKLDLRVIHTVLDKLVKKANSNPALDFIRDKLYSVAVNPELVGTSVHKELVELYNQIKVETRTQSNSQILARINKLKQIINEYQRDSTSFTYGSNRAMKANEIEDMDLENIGVCVQVECPIYIQEGPGCVVFKHPTGKSFLSGLQPSASGLPTNYIQSYTSDYWLESPFELGCELIKWITPGVYCKEMVERMDKNPYSMEPIIGWIPLTSDPGVAMRHMSKVFGGKKELWHFARGYCGFLVCLAEKPWMEEHKEKIRKTLQDFIKVYRVSEDIKSSSNKVPLEQALKYVIKNFSVCLRDRFYNDIVTICKIVEFAFPDFEYPKDKIMSMASVIKSFDSLLRIYKQGETMLPYVMEVDDWDHYICAKKGVDGLIAQLLWYDLAGTYKLSKLQIAIDRSFGDKKFGKAIKAAFNGTDWDESILECALPELEGLELTHNVWTPNGLDELICGYDGKKFSSSKEKIDHIRKLLGPYFFNGHASVRAAIRELGVNAPHKTIFSNAKAKLFKAYGEQAKVLHTARAKRKLIEFIEKMTQKSI